jgi:hypothetical protein
MGDFFIVVGVILYFIGWVGSVRLAFFESTYLGFWVLFVPVVWIYFLFTRIANTAKFAAFSIVGLVIMLLGIFVHQSNL